MQKKKDSKSVCTLVRHLFDICQAKNKSVQAAHSRLTTEKWFIGKLLVIPQDFLLLVCGYKQTKW
jgi:hypothetical protein